MGKYPVRGRIQMKRLVIMAIAALGFALVVGSAATYAQATFTIPFKLRSRD